MRVDNGDIFGPQLKIKKEILSYSKKLFQRGQKNR